MRCGIFAVIVVVSSSNLGIADEPVVEIPLSEIWSNCAEDARPLRDLEPELFVNLDTPEKIAEYSTPEAQETLRRKAGQSIVMKLEAALLLPDRESRAPESGFAVVGVDLEALPGVHDVLVKGDKPRLTFSSDDALTVVFFTRPSVPRVVIERIEWQARVLQIHYTLYSQGRLSALARLALIPVGVLAPGNYRVEMIRSARTERDQRGFPPVEQGAERDIVCEPFEFTVSPTND